jgi:hypothetical protein
MGLGNLERVSVRQGTTVGDQLTAKDRHLGALAKAVANTCLISYARCADIQHIESLLAYLNRLVVVGNYRCRETFL